MVDVGTVIAARYRLEALIAEGGMGSVWAARHLALDKLVAIKLIAGGDPTGEMRRRFDREARSAARVRHRNVVEVLDFGEENGAPFLVMALLEGESLAARIARLGPASIEDVGAWMDQVLAGLGAIHAAGIVHRDLKPANVFLARDAEGEIVKLLDFGIARMNDDAAATTGHAVGTPAYMAPEQLTSPKDIDARTDVWAAGVVLYEVLAGRRPFVGDTPYEVVGAILSRQPPLPIAGLPQPLTEIVIRALQFDGAQRYPDAATMRRALGAVTGRTPTSSQPHARVSDLGLARTEPAIGRTTRQSADELPDAAPPTRRRRRGSNALLFGVTFAGFGLLASLSLCCLVDRAWVAAPPPAPSGVAPGSSVEPGAPPLVIVGGPGSGAQLLVTWRHLPEADRALVHFAEQNGQLVAVLDGANASGNSERLARAFGGIPSGFLPATTSMLQPRLARSDNRLRVLTDATGDDVAGVIPSGTAMVVLEGQLGSSASTVGAPDGRVRVGVSATLDGWVAADEIAEWTACIPSASALDDGRLAIVDTTAPPARRRDPMFLLFALGDPGAVTLARQRDDCGLETIATAPAGRPIAEIFMTRTAEDGGSLIVMIGRWAANGERDGLIGWEANRVLLEPGRFDPVWRIELYSGHVFAEGARDRIVGPLQNRPGRGTGFWPLRVHQGGRDTYYVWSEGGLFSRAGFVAEP